MFACPIWQLARWAPFIPLGALFSIRQGFLCWKREGRNLERGMLLIGRFPCPGAPRLQWSTGKSQKSSVADLHSGKREQSFTKKEPNPKTQASFFFLPQKFCGNSAKLFWEFCNFDGRSGLASLCISAMILVALQNNSLIDFLCNRKYFLFVKLIFSVFIFP